MKKTSWKKVRIEQLDDRFLLINLYATQAVLLAIALIMILLQQQTLTTLLQAPHSVYHGLMAIGFATIVLLANAMAGFFLPADILDDGGLNEKIFKNRSYGHIFLIAGVVAFSEELLFRGAFQYLLGNYWTSVVFTAIHIRYLRHWLLTAMVFAISYGLGWIYQWSGQLWTSVFAHFIIDFSLGAYLKWKGGNKNADESK